MVWMVQMGWLEWDGDGSKSGGVHELQHGSRDAKGPRTLPPSPREPEGLERTEAPEGGPWGHTAARMGMPFQTSPAPPILPPTSNLSQPFATTPSMQPPTSAQLSLLMRRFEVRLGTYSHAETSRCCPRLPVVPEP